MDDERGDIITELINYYDAPNNADSDSPDKSASMGETRVIRKSSDELPREEILGATTEVKAVRKKAAARAAANTVKAPKPKAVKSETTRVTVPVSEEVFGTLGIDGRPIEKKEPEKVETPPKREKKPPETNPFIYVRSEDAPRRHKRSEESVWFMLKPLWITLIVAVSCMAAFKFYITDTGLIGIYKQNFGNNMDAILEHLGIGGFEDELPVVGAVNTTESPYINDNTTMTEAENMVSEENTLAENAQTDNENRQDESSLYTEAKADTVILPFDEAGSSDFSVYGNGVVCVKSNYMCCVDASGEIRWETALSINSPIVSAAGKYIAVASEGGTLFSLYRGAELCFTVDANNAIRTCVVSSRGDVALITDRRGYKGAIEVYNSKGEQIYSWASGVNYITAVSMTETRRMVLALAGTSSDVTSYVMVFDVNSDMPRSGIKLENTLAYRICPNGRTINVIGDNSISRMSDGCDITYDLRFDNAYVNHCAYDTSGTALVAYTADNIPVLNVFNKRGKNVYDAVTESVPDYIDICGSAIVYNNGRHIIYGKYDSDERYVHTAAMNIKGLKLLNARTYMIVYQDSLEFVREKG